MLRYALCLLVAPVCFPQYALRHPLPFEWPSDTAQAAVLAKKLTADSVAADLFNNAGDPDVPETSVEEFTFEQLERGKMYLVASVDGSGRGLYYATAFANCGSPQLCTSGVVYDAPPHDYCRDVVDLDGNGVKAIIAKELAGGYEGGNSVYIFTYKIYKVVHGTPVNVSARYKAYYESTLLPRMQADLDRARARHTGEKDREITEALGVIRPG